MNNSHETKQYNIPQELFADILRILLKSKIQYQLTGVKSRTNIILISVKYTQDRYHAKAKENIESLLDDFSHYMEGLSDSVVYANEEEY